MKKQETMPDAQYRKSVREIIKRDFFPELSSDKIDETVDKFGSLNSFCASCVSAEDADFVAQVEQDRQLLKSYAPLPRSPIPYLEGRLVMCISIPLCLLYPISIFYAFSFDQSVIYKEHTAFIFFSVYEGKEDVRSLASFLCCRLLHCCQRDV